MTSHQEGKSRRKVESSASQRIRETGDTTTATLAEPNGNHRVSVIVSFASCWAGLACPSVPTEGQLAITRQSEATETSNGWVIGCGEVDSAASRLRMCF